MDCGGTGLASHRAGLRRAALNRNGALLGLVIFPATFLASVLGYVNLANLLGNGALKSAYVAAPLDAANRGRADHHSSPAGPASLGHVVRSIDFAATTPVWHSPILAVLVWLSFNVEVFALQDSDEIWRNPLEPS